MMEREVEKKGAVPGRRAVFMMPPKVHLLDISGPAHIFYEAACMGADVGMVFSSILADTAEAESSCALAFAKLVPFNQLTLQAGDLVFVPGLDASLLLDEVFLECCRAFQYWLVQQHRRGAIISSVCTGAFLLGETGLLDGRSCTTHWKYAERFSERYPKAKLLHNRLFVQEDRLYTSAGVSSGIDLALHLAENLWGASLASKIAKETVVYFRRGLDDPQLSVFTRYRNHLEHRIHLVQDRLAASLDRKISIEELAQGVNMSPRNLARLFKKHTELSIGTYLEKLRAERAAQLIGEGHTIQSAALQCGLKSANSIRYLLRNTK